MWANWKEHLEAFGADEFSFVMASKGGNQSQGTIIKAARCILKFGKDTLPVGTSPPDSVDTYMIMQKLLNNERVKVGIGILICTIFWFDIF